jgi:glycosyltransferase involved in cell wall biosynthesis
MSDPEPLVTVVMPAYNAEAWIGEAVDSVLAQTMPDWELIVVDDGSTDGTAGAVRQYADRRIRLVSQPNRGPSAARNRGIALARGRYVSLLDADDWYDPRHLELTTAFLGEHAECGLVAANFCFVNARGERTVGCKPGEVLGRPGRGVIPDYFRLAMRNRNVPVTCGTAFRRDLVPALGDFDEALDGAEDRDFQVRWALGTRFGYVDEVLGYYRDYVPGSVRKDLPTTLRTRLRLWRKLTGAEPVPPAHAPSYARMRSYFLFRLVALAIATGYLDVAREAAALWPASPHHLSWWAGQALALLPRFCQRAIHIVLRRFSFVQYRLGVTSSTECR